MAALAWSACTAERTTRVLGNSPDQHPAGSSMNDMLKLVPRRSRGTSPKYRPPGSRCFNRSDLASGAQAVVARARKWSGERHHVVRSTGTTFQAAQPSTAGMPARVS